MENVVVELVGMPVEGDGSVVPFRLVPSVIGPKNLIAKDIVVDVEIPAELLGLQAVLGESDNFVAVDLEVVDRLVRVIFAAQVERFTPELVVTGRLDPRIPDDDIVLSGSNYDAGCARVPDHDVFHDDMVDRPGQRSLLACADSEGSLVAAGLSPVENDSPDGHVICPDACQRAVRHPNNRLVTIKSPHHDMRS